MSSQSLWALPLYLPCAITTGEVLAYTNGRGRLFCNLDGYQPCHNAQEVIAEIGYDSESDLENPTGSVFCANGTSFLVSWNEVKTYMHLEPYFKAPHGRGDQSISKSPKKEQDSSTDDDYYYLGLVNPKQATKARELRRRPSREPMKDPLEAVSKEEKPKENYLLVDGYNIIYAWPELREQAENENMEGARMGLLNALSNYQAIKTTILLWSLTPTARSALPKMLLTMATSAWSSLKKRKQLTNILRSLLTIIRRSTTSK